MRLFLMDFQRCLEMVAIGLERYEVIALILLHDFIWINAVGPGPLTIQMILELGEIVLRLISSPNTFDFKIFLIFIRNIL